MKKTYITSMPDHIGAFLKASQCFAALGINITRVSYNKAVDSHTLFIDAEGSEEQLKKADYELKKIGYLNDNNDSQTSVILLEFRLRDIPGSVTDVLKLISEFNFNISYISSQENETDYQYFKMGLYVDDFDRLSVFLRRANELCRVLVIDYNPSKNVYDNSIFYKNYVLGLSEMMGLSAQENQNLLININLAMQTLDEKGLSPYKTFDSISKFAELLSISKGQNFAPRISTHKITENTEITTIEPPCGSNTAIIKSNGNYLFIDSGYACYQKEMLEIFEKTIPEFNSIKKQILITHADVDHCGLLPIFDEILVNEGTAKSLKNEYYGLNGYREENPLHKPYINICKILTEYKPVNPQNFIELWKSAENYDSPLTKIGVLNFGELEFDVFEGKGGHLPGEIILIDHTNHIAFTGDVYINVHGLTPEQEKYNRYAPILMTSVDTDPKLCSEERSAILQQLSTGNWQIFGAHGFKKDYNVD